MNLFRNRLTLIYIYSGELLLPTPTYLYLPPPKSASLFSSVLLRGREARSDICLVKLGYLQQFPGVL